MKLRLPDVTVVAIDCVAHGLTKLALKDTLDLIEPGDTIVFSDEIFNSYSVECKCFSILDVANLLWHNVHTFVNTTHILIIQWDGFVINPNMWDDKWLQYDYIGAPWPWHDSYYIGNGGFSLRSKDLMKHLAKNQSRFPVLHPEDDTLCRRYRPILELTMGFQWAPKSIAEKFSLEHGEMRSSFGFHDCRNFPRILSSNAITKRLNLANDYVRSKTEWQGLCQSLESVGTQVC